MDIVGISIYHKNRVVKQYPSFSFYCTVVAYIHGNCILLQQIVSNISGEISAEMFYPCSLLFTFIWFYSARAGVNWFVSRGQEESLQVLYHREASKTNRCSARSQEETLGGCEPLTGRAKINLAKNGFFTKWVQNRPFDVKLCPAGAK